MKSRRHKFSVYLNDEEFKMLHLKASAKGIRANDLMRILIMKPNVYLDDNLSEFLKHYFKITNKPFA